MRLPISTTAMLLFSLSTLSLASAQPHSLPFNTTYLFTAKVLLGAPPTDPSKNPVTIPGGAIVPEPILGGTVTGPYLNANITSGLATPRVYRNGTLQQPVIDLYGVAEGGVPLVLHETGIGAPEAQVTRLEVSIGGGGKYDVLKTGFILATVTPNAERTAVTVEGYLIQNTADT